MIRRVIFVLIILLLAAGGVSAQTDFDTMSKNIVTFDLGPAIVFGGVNILAGNLLKDIDGGISIGNSGFGFGFQYERHIMQRLSVAGRFSYLGFGVGYSDEYASLEIDFSSLSIEGHARYYPLKGTFFIDGMTGYSRFTLGLSGKIDNKDVSFSEPRNFIKFGAKTGWRFSSGKTWGFVFEISAGYNFAFGMGDDFEVRIINKIADIMDVDANDVAEEVNEFTSYFGLLENLVFVGGPRITISVGFRF